MDEAIRRIETLANPDSFFGWMCGIMSNQYGKLNRRTIDGKIDYTGLPPEREDESTGVDNIVRAVDGTILHEAIEHLPPKLKEAVLLRYFADMPLTQIARFLMIPVGTVNSRLHMARMVLTMRLSAKLKKPAVALIAAGLFLAASAAATVGILSTAGGNDETNGASATFGTDGAAALEADRSQGTPVVSDISPGPDVPPSSSTKEKTTMKRITISRLFSGAVKCLTALSTTMLAAREANAADPYVESDGTAGILTDYYMTTNSRIEVDFAMTVVEPSVRVFGEEERTDKDGLGLSLYLPGQSQKFAFRVKSGGIEVLQWSSVTPVAGNRHTAVFDIYHDKLYFITSSVTNSSLTASRYDTADIGSFTTNSTQPIALFAWPNAANNPIGNPAKARIYGCKIYERDVLVRDFEPCTKDGLVGFRDRIGGRFYMNNRAKEYLDAFTVGGDYTKYTSPYVATPANNSDTYINTGYSVISNTCVELDCAPISDWNGTLCYAFGASGGSNDADAGNYNIFFAYFRHDLGFAARTLNTSGGWIQGFTPAGLLTNGVGGAVTVRRTFAIDTAASPNGTRSAYVKTAGVSNGSKAIHALHLTKPSYHTLCLASAHAGTGTKSSLRIYGCRIAENGATVRDYVPAVVNGVPGLQDSLSGGGFVGATAGTLTPGGFVPVVSASAGKISSRQLVTVTATAPGAVSYCWFRNGEAISGGEDGTLEVSWRKGNAIDTYRAVSVSICAGETLVSEMSPVVTLENLPKGTAIILR